MLLVLAVAWSVVSAIVSDAWRVSLLGTVGRDVTALMFLACAGLWGLGRLTRSGTRDLLAVVAPVALATSALVGVAQVAFDVRSGSLALAAGRPTGLTSNPVYFGALCAGGLVGALAHSRARRSPVLLVSAALLGIAVSLSGSRVALGAALLGLLTLVARRRDRAAAEVAGFGGVALGAGIVLDRAIGQGRNGLDRVSSGGGGGRLDVWRYSIHSWWERPIVGFGPGQFRAAVQHRFDAEFVRANATDDLTQAWFDAHNVVINVLVAVGVVGTVLIAAWVVTAARRSRGPLLWTIAPIATTWLLQPVSIYTLPLCCVLFGAAYVECPAHEVLTVGPDNNTTPRIRAWPSAVAITIGCLLGMWLVVADFRLSRSADHGDPAAAASAASMYLGDPVVDDLVAQIIARSSSSRAVRIDVLEWRRHAADHEPNRPYWWSSIAAWQIGLDDFDGAADSLEVAFELQPNNVRTEEIAAQLAYEVRDEAALAQSLDRLCTLGNPEACDTDAGEVLSEAEAADDRGATP